MALKKLLSSIILILLVMNAYTQGVSFEKKTWTALLAKAKDEKKPIFLDLYTTWCGPCKMLEKQVYPDAKVGKFMNQNYINTKIDAEKGEGIKLAQQFNIDSYPTLIFLNPNGEEIYRYSGFNESEDFIIEAKTALKKVNQPSLASLKKQYLAGNRKQDFLYEYLTRLKDETPGSIDNNQLIDDYLSSKKEAISDIDLQLLWDNLSSIKFGTKAYNIVKSNIRQLYQITEQVDIKETELLPNIDTFIGFYDMERAFIAKNEEDFKKTKSIFIEKAKLANNWFSFPDRNVFLIESDLYISLDNEAKYREVCKNFIEKAYPIDKSIDDLTKIHMAEYNKKLKQAGGSDAEITEIIKQQAKTAFMAEIAMEINNVAWDFYEKNYELAWALKYSKHSLNFDNQSAYMDTYAHLLYRNGKKEEAIKNQEKALEKAKINNENLKEFEAELSKMKAGKL
jgi:thiol-disulfide isomerase/thioredoxin